MTMSTENTKLGIVITVVLTSILVGFVVYEINSMYAGMHKADEEYKQAVEYEKLTEMSPETKSYTCQIIKAANGKEVYGDCMDRLG